MRDKYIKSVELVRRGAGPLHLKMANNVASDGCSREGLVKGGGGAEIAIWSVLGVGVTGSGIDQQHHRSVCADTCPRQLEPFRWRADSVPYFVGRGG